jgi:hypothetical protein
MLPLSPRPSIEQIPIATLHEMPAGHGPWLVDSKRTAELTHMHLDGIVSERRRTCSRISHVANSARTR